MAICFDTSMPFQAFITYIHAQAYLHETKSATQTNINKYEHLCNQNSDRDCAAHSQSANQDAHTAEGNAVAITIVN